MKKIISFIMVATILITVSACGNNQSEQTNEKNSKSLVVYFSLPETSSPENMTVEEENSAVIVDGKVLGNTEYVANIIKDNTDSDIFRIEAKTPYTLNHDELVEQAQKEQDENARPEIKEEIENIDQYDRIFIGYPNWWGDMPMILYTFLEEYDLSGKTIIPFNTHGGSGFSGTIETISEIQKDANVETNGYSVSRDDVADSEAAIIEWLKELGYLK